MRSQKAFNNVFCELSKIARPLYVRRVAAHLRSSDKAKSSAKSAPSPTDSSPIAAVKLSFVTTFLLQPAEQQLRRLHEDFVDYPGSVAANPDFAVRTACKF